MKALRFPAVFAGLFVLLLLLFPGGVFHWMFEGSAHREGALARPTLIPVPGQQDDTASFPGEELRPDVSPPTSRLRSMESLMTVLKEAADGKLISNDDADRFLEAKGLTAFNLLALSEATGNEEFIRRAAEQFPDHPAVQAAVLSGKVRTLSPEERAEWIAHFKATAPDDPLPFVYAAMDAFRAQDYSSALAEASSAIQKPGLYMWSNEQIDAAQQLYEFLRFTPLEAELLATVNRSLPHMNAFEAASNELIKWHGQAMKIGDTSSADEALRIAYGLGEVLRSPEGSRLVITQLSGMTLQSRVLKALSPDALPTFLGVSPAQRQAELSRSRDSYKGLVSDQTLDVLLGERSSDLLPGYLKRFRHEGEYQALIWVKKQLGPEMAGK